MNISESTRDLLEVWPMGNQLDLPSGYTAIVAGAYKGRVIQLLAERWPDYSSIHGFEPQAWAIEEARARIAREGIRDAIIHPYAIGLSTREVTIVEWGTDAASVVALDRSHPRESGLGVMLEYQTAMDLVGLTRVDLFVMNMEGYEFDLIPHMWAGPWFPDRLAVQWHPLIESPSFAHPDRELQVLLGATHNLAIDDWPRWQYWIRREIDGPHD